MISSKLPLSSLANPFIKNNLAKNLLLQKLSDFFLQIEMAKPGTKAYNYNKCQIVSMTYFLPAHLSNEIQSAYILNDFTQLSLRRLFLKMHNDYLIIIK